MVYADKIIQESNQKIANIVSTNVIVSTSHILKVTNSNNNLAIQTDSLKGWCETIGRELANVNNRLENRDVKNKFINSNSIDNIYSKSLNLANSEMKNGYGGKYKPVDLNIPKNKPDDFLTINNIIDVNSVIKYMEDHVNNKENKEKIKEYVINMYSKVKK